MTITIIGWLLRGVELGNIRNSKDKIGPLTVEVNTYSCFVLLIARSTTMLLMVTVKSILFIP